MPLSLESRRVGDITVVNCRGRIVEGAESQALRQLLDDLLASGPHVILNLGGVDFIDSSGLGLLVRYATRTRNANGSLKLCTLSPRVVDVLTVTRLHGAFESYETATDAIAAFYRHGGPAGSAPRLDIDILCVEIGRAHV